jgi:hypothetical protein
MRLRRRRRVSSLSAIIAHLLQVFNTFKALLIEPRTLTAEKQKAALIHRAARLGDVKHRFRLTTKVQA